MLLNSKLNKNKPIAYICSPRIGDSLFSMVTVNNLVRNGYQVVVYSDVLKQLQEFFPWATIFPAISIKEQKILEQYPSVLHMYNGELAVELSKWHANSVVLSDSSIYHDARSMADIQMLVCQRELGLTNVVRDNNIFLPADLVYRKFLQRVVIQPTSSQAFRNWPAKKFMRLAKLLSLQGLDPIFVVAPAEYEQWNRIIQNQFDLKSFKALNEAAYFIYESAWFIGNDSGMGHLASNLGVPTLTLFVRPKLARQWRPTWAYGHFVLPPWWLITRPLREKFWGQSTTVKRVWHEFKQLVNGYEKQITTHNN